MGNNDSRTLFRDHIQQLVNEDIAGSSDFWQSLFTLEASFEDISAMVSSADITRLHSDFLGNFTKLLDFSIQFLEESFNQVLILDNTQLLCTTNAVKFLTRILQIQVSTEDFQEIWLENPRLFRMIRACFGLLHAPIYSVLASTKIISSVDSISVALLWKEGLFTSNFVVEASEPMWLRRFELLGLIKVCISDFASESPNGAKLIVKEPWISQTFYSLLNTLITFNPAGPWKIPYASYAKSVYKEQTLKIGLQVCCALDFFPTSQNVLKKLFKNIKERGDLAMIWNGIKDIIGNVHVSQNTYLPGSQKAFKIEKEAIFLLFVLAKENELFVQTIVADEKCLEIIIPILEVLLQGNDRFIGLLCVYILIKLSENRSFCVKLNKSLEFSSVDLPLFTGNYSDLLINAFSKLIFTENSYMGQSFHLFLIVLSNISCYSKRICSISSHNILKLLQSTFNSFLSDPKKSGEPLTLLLETLNNSIQYQWRGSLNLLYWLLQYSSLFLQIQKACSENLQVLLQVSLIVISNLTEFSGLAKEKFLEITEKTTLVGLLPVPHALVTRKINFQDEKLLALAFESFFLG